MSASLPDVLRLLKAHEVELRQRGVQHAAVFGSVSRRDEREDSDIDILVELDPKQPMGVFQYASLKLYVNGLLGGRADVVNRKTLKPLLRESILREVVDAF